MEDYFPVIFGLFSLLVLIIFFWSLTNSANRVQKLKKIAKTFGFEFIDYAPESMIAPLKERLPIFTRGKKRFIRNVLQGKMGTLPVKIFDFEYWLIINGRERETKTILWIELQDKTTPKLLLRPRSWLDNFIKSELPLQKWIISGDDAEWLKACLDKPTIERLESFPGLNVQAIPNHLIIYFETTGSNDNLLQAEKQKYQDLLAAGNFILNLLQARPLVHNVSHE